MGKLLITINTRESSGTNADQINPIKNDKAVIGRLSKWIQGIGVKGSFLTIESGGTKSSGTLTISPNAADGDTAVINGVTLTARNAPSAAAEFQIGASIEETAKNLADKINSLSTVNIFVVAGYVAGVVTVEALAPGAVGDNLTLSALGNITASGANLTGGASGTVTNIELGRSATAA